MPSCTRPYRRAVIRGLAGWIYIDLQRPAHWPWHQHPNHVKVIIGLEGADFLIKWHTENLGEPAVMEIEGEHVCVVPAGLQHEVQWRIEAPILVFYLDTDWVELLIRRTVNRPSLEPLRRYVQSAPVIDDLCRLLRDRGCGSQPPNTAAVAGLAAALASELLLTGGSLQPESTDSESKLPQFAFDIVAAYVREHLAEKITLPELARKVGLSPSYFGQLFRSRCGQSPITYLISQRATWARELLSTGRFTVKEVAHAVGFSDQSQMARHFRAMKRPPPRDYIPPR